MNLERSKNTVRNIKVIFAFKVVSLLNPFIVRTIFIKTLGADYLGVNSLFTSILTVLSLAELGFGSAIAFSMYKAISCDDENQICALLYFFRKIYRIIGLIIVGIGCLFIPFLPSLVNGSYPDTINPVIVYLVFLGNTALSYFLFAYYNSLINAFQRNDLISRIGIYVNLAMYSIQILLLLWVKNYYVYIAIMPVFTVINNIIVAIAARKMFPQYIPKGSIDRETKNTIRSNVGGLLIQKICKVSRNAFDSIFVSMFLGLTEIAIYNNYYYIMNSITGIVSIAASAMLAGVGNSVASESSEKNLGDMQKLNFAYLWISGWCTCCLLCLYQPFMKIWVGNNLMLPYSSVILFCAYFYVLKMGDIRGVYADAKGIWWQQRFRALLEALCNIILNYFMGKYFGLNGIVVATLISLFVINFCYGSTLVFKYYFGSKNCLAYFKFHAITTSVVVFSCVITFTACYFIPETILGLMIKGIICCILPNCIMMIIYRKTKMYKESIPWILSRLGIHKNGKLWKFVVE